MPDIQKNLNISLLLDFYGQMLTDKQKEAIVFYYNHDLSLAEIAQHSGITRQGVRDSIKRAERQLLEYEEKLGLYEKFHKTRDGLQEIVKYANEIQEENKRLIDSDTIDSNVKAIIDTVEELKF